MSTTTKTKANLNHLKSVRKRRRAVTSCTDCHRRKQKCDREMPCTNCSIRGNEPKCHYELFPPTAEGIHGHEHIIKFNARSFSRLETAAHLKPLQPNEDNPLKVLGFSDENPATSLGIFNKSLDAAGSIPAGTITSLSEPSQTSSAWYKAYLRQLPPIFIIDKLATNFFNTVNWQYNPLDAVTFMQDKVRWDALPYADLSKNIRALPTETRFFPAMLFQVLALSILHWGLNDTSLECLKHKSDMTLEDVAREYSEAGVALLSALAKDGVPRSGIQARFLRTLFLKTTGKVVESWHSLGETIDGARRLQWHLDVPSEQTIQRANPIPYLWDCETRRKTWLNLCCWDAHMATMLGRRIRITLGDMETTPPVDAPVIQDRTRIVPYPRAEFDPPTPLTIQIVNHSIARFLVRISSIEQSSGIYGQVQDLHEEIMDFSEHLPPYLWVENPDRRFDAHPDCFWLHDTRQAVEATISFAILALHRPYIFKNSKNRTQALKAGLCTIRAERIAVVDLPLRKYRSFSYLYGTFDATVTVAVIYTLYPKDSPRSLEDAVQGVETVLNQFERITSLNPLADTAAKVLKALHIRLRRATRSLTPPFSVTSTISNAENLCRPWTPPVSSISGSQIYQAAEDHIEYNLEAISPPLPLHDLLYNNLSSASLNTEPFTDFSVGQLHHSNLDCQFQGQFDDDAFWNILNQMELG